MGRGLDGKLAQMKMSAEKSIILLLKRKRRKFSTKQLFDSLLWWEASYYYFQKFLRSLAKKYPQLKCQKADLLLANKIGCHPNSTVWWWEE